MNKLIACIVSCCFLMGTYFPATGQYYKTGEDPARLKWNQLQAGPYKIIFPRERTPWLFVTPGYWNRPPLML